MEEIIKKLKQEIINHDLVKNSSLFGLVLWKMGHYNILSEIISESLSKSEFMQGSRKNDLGTSISGSTLKRIFTTTYTNNESTDLRFLKTLDKFAIFLGYPNLNGYMLHQSQNDKVKISKEKGKVIEDIQDINLPFSFFTERIINCCDETFEIMKKLPTFDMGRLSDYAFEEGSFYKRIADMILKFSENNLRLNCEGNRSNVEIYGFKLKNINEDSVVISVKEFANIYMVDENGKTIYLINESTSQLYFFKRINGVWKIWDNHNPGYDTLAAAFLKS
ncbi:MAG: hypothetical protein ABI426_09650 [Flavobacterium sp.]